MKHVAIAVDQQQTIVLDVGQLDILQSVVSVFVILRAITGCITAAVCKVVQIIQAGLQITSLDPVCNLLQHLTVLLLTDLVIQWDYLAMALVSLIALQTTTLQ